MKPGDELPIEPLPESAWNRIEEAVWDELDRGPRARSGAPARARMPRWAVAAIAALVAAQLTAAAVFLLLRRGPDAQRPLDSMRMVAEQSASDSVLGDVAIHLEPATALVAVRHAEGGALLLLERGAASFSVPPREQRPPFVVQAGDVRVEVVGTRFRVERAGGSARVAAYEGTVRVLTAGKTALLHRGDRWPAAAAANAIPRQPPPSAASPVLRAEPASPASSSDPAAPAPQPLDRRARFERAAALEARDPAQALRLYQALASEGGRWGENALYAMGRLELESQHTERARQLLQRYLDRHPRGANASDARALLERIGREPKGNGP